MAALLTTAPRLWAASTAEARAFTSATNLFGLGFYGPAEEALGKFAQAFPDSTHYSEAILYQAQALIKLTGFAQAVSLLAANQARAGTNADQFLFWQAEAHFRAGEYPAARDGFARLVAQFPASSRRLEAGLSEAAASMRLTNWPAAIDVLQRPDGVFQKAIRAHTTNDLVAGGYMLLAEAHLAEKEYARAEAALQPLADFKLPPGMAWRRQYALCELQLARGQNEQALQSTTNLLTLAANTAQPSLVAHSISLQAGLFEKADRADDAIAAYQKNLVESAPEDLQLQALQKVTELCLARNKSAQAAQALQQFLDRAPHAPTADVALLTLGELRLRQWVSGQDTNAPPITTTNAPTTTTTNALELAVQSLRTLTSQFTNSPLQGKAYLDLGWCFWTNDLPQSQANFEAAAAHLPFSADQATAYFKLADTKYWQTNYAGAISDYSAVADRFAALPEVRTNLLERALYQIVQAGVEGGKLTGSEQRPGQTAGMVSDRLPHGRRPAGRGARHDPTGRPGPRAGPVLGVHQGRAG